MTLPSRPEPQSYTFYILSWVDLSGEDDTVTRGQQTEPNFERILHSLGRASLLNLADKLQLLPINPAKNVTTLCSSSCTTKQIC